MSSRSTEAAPIGPALGIVLDLDDTLYLERDFVAGGFEAAGWCARDALGLKGFGPLCQRLFDEGVRGNVFDRALEIMGVRDAGEAVGALVDAYRTHRPAIRLPPDADRFIAAHRSDRLGLVTDGPSGVQRGKIAALGLAERIDAIVVTGELGPGFGKPHRRPFRQVARRLALPAERLVYIADNALKDFVTPNALGWLTIGVERRGRIHVAPPPSPAHAPRRSVSDLDEAGWVLSGWRAAMRAAA